MAGGTIDLGLVRGPNQVTGTTSTTLSGILMGGSGGYVEAATADVDYSTPTALAGVVAAEILVVNIAAFSALPVTVTNSAIKASHVVLESHLGTPSAQAGDWSVTTANGSLTISGLISGSTTLRMILGYAGTTI